LDGDYIGIEIAFW